MVNKLSLERKRNHIFVMNKNPLNSRISFADFAKTWFLYFENVFHFQCLLREGIFFRKKLDQFTLENFPLNDKVEFIVFQVVGKLFENLLHLSVIDF